MSREVFEKETNKMAVHTYLDGEAESYTLDYCIWMENRIQELESLGNHLKVGMAIEKARKANSYAGRMAEGWDDAIDKLTELITE